MMPGRAPQGVAALRALLVATCLGCLRTGHAQAFTMPSLTDLPALPNLATGLVNAISSGTKAGAARPIGGGLAVIVVNPYGCNAPAVPLQSWNIDLQQNYLLRGVTLNALAIPSQGTNVEVRAAKTMAELSTWSGNNPLCAAFKLTTANLGVTINCTQPIVARYMTIADVDTSGTQLPVCSLDALVNQPLPPAPAPEASAGAPGPAVAWYPPLAPREAQQSLAPSQQGASFPPLSPAASAGGASHGSAQTWPGSGPGLGSVGSSQPWKPPVTGGAPVVVVTPGQAGGKQQQQPAAAGPAPEMRPLLPAEVQASSSMSSPASSADPASTVVVPQGGHATLTNSGVVGIAAGVFIVIAVVIGTVTYIIISRDAARVADAERLTGKGMYL